MCQEIKKSEWQLNLIRQHINSYFRMESHYCRQTTKRQYLDSSLSVVKMYEQFVLYCHQQLQLENQRECGTCLVTQHSGGGAALHGEISIIIPADNPDIISHVSASVSETVATAVEKSGLASKVQPVNDTSAAEQPMPSLSSQTSFMPAAIEHSEAVTEENDTFGTTQSKQNSAECMHLNKIPSQKIYRDVFVSEFNLGFFIPKKDQCVTCNIEKSRLKTNDVAASDEYIKHIEQKNRAQLEKKRDKQRMDTDPQFLSATFDLQSILQIPCGDTSQLYYKRKLALHNLTIYESSSPNRAFCNVWLEVDGRRAISVIQLHTSVSFPIAAQAKIGISSWPLCYCMQLKFFQYTSLTKNI